MKKHSLKEWIIATRPWSFPASTMPVLVTMAWSAWQADSINWWIGLWTMVTMGLFQAVGNTWSDYFDYKKGVDARDTFGSTNITSGLFSPEEILWLSIGLTVVTALSGIGLALVGGCVIWVLGVAGMLLAGCYPWLKYHALGDVDIFLCYALLPMMGTTLMVTGTLLPEVWPLTIPVGLITVGILHANNARDEETDRRAGITTLPILFGRGFSRWAYYIEVLFPFAWIAGCCVLGVLPLWALLTFVALVPAVQNARTMSRFTTADNTPITSLDERTAQLQLIFSVLFAAGLLVATFL